MSAKKWLLFKLWPTTFDKDIRFSEDHIKTILHVHVYIRLGELTLTGK